MYKMYNHNDTGVRQFIKSLPEAMVKMRKK